MKTQKTFIVLSALLVSGWLLTVQSCKKQDQSYIPQSLSVTFPRLELFHELYYRIGYDARSIELVFSEPVDQGTVPGSLILSCQESNQVISYDLEISGRVVFIKFHSGFFLREGWIYKLTICTTLASLSGNKLPVNKTIELRTTTIPLGLDSGLPGADTLPRHSIAVISDIHMGDARATAGKYGWFGKNKVALESFLDDVINGGDIRQLVIQGDLFDEWIIPYDVVPFDSQAGIQNSRDYFHAIAESPVNSVIFDKLRAIALDTAIDLIYIPGNHDMLMTPEILEELIPGIRWLGDDPGLGKYIPVPEIVMEHGHRYDFFNCPQSLVNPGHMLPPGFFISRLYAYGSATHPGLQLKEGVETQGGLEFLTAWTLALGYTLVHFEMLPPSMDQHIVLMSGIDGYDTPFSFNGARDMYASSIEDLWMTTQSANGVPVPISVFAGIWNGFDLTSAAITEYMKQAPHMTSYRVISFGHSHNPFLEVYPPGNNYTNIYANSGSWVDADQCKYNVRTFLVLTPGSWTGSGLDVVQLYQYNLESNSGIPGNGYAPVLLAEENININ
ncbi:MAG: metallophosphoesterase [bacterium]